MTTTNPARVPQAPGDGAPADPAEAEVRRRRAIGRWAAVAGGAALVAYGLARRSVAGGALVLIGGGLIYRGAVAEETQRAAVRRIRVHTSVIINRPADQLYRFWRNFENLPRFMKHLQIAQSSGGRRSHWVATAPLGARVTWDAEITDERENELIAWRALPTSDVQNAGEVQFQPAPDGQGTEVTVTMEYEPPAGELGAAVAKLFGEEPQQQVEDDLRRLKQIMESEDGAPDDGR